MKIELVFKCRKFFYFKIKQWYSLYRWKNPNYLQGRKIKLIDIGAITIGYRIKEKEK